MEQKKRIRRKTSVGKGRRREEGKSELMVVGGETSAREEVARNE